MTKGSIEDSDTGPTADSNQKPNLGPSDSSDSGSDLAGPLTIDPVDPSAPLDVILRDDLLHPLIPPHLDDSRASDSSGTGELGGVGEGEDPDDAPDISVDRVISPDEGMDEAFLGEDARAGP
ncbi:MAG: hypothetical protein V4792_04320 [Pseudomonadota bacterium]